MILDSKAKTFHINEKEYQMILAGEGHPNVLGDFGIYPGLKLENASQSFSSFNPFSASSPSWAEDDKKLNSVHWQNCCERKF